MSTQSTTKLIYGFDPLCGWCFAMAPTIKALRANLGDQVRWEVACGGLVTGARVEPIGRASDYLKRGLAQVEMRSGMKAGQAFVEGLLAEGSWVSRSEPGCRATLCVQQVHGGAAAVDFGSALCVAFYQDGLKPDEPSTIKHVLEELGLDASEVLSTWDTEAQKQSTQRAFARATSQGVRSYPTLFIEKAGRRSTLLPGWAAPESALEHIQHHLRREDV